MGNGGRTKRDRPETGNVRSCRALGVCLNSSRTWDVTCDVRTRVRDVALSGARGHARACSAAYARCKGAGRTCVLAAAEFAHGHRWDRRQTSSVERRQSVPLGWVGAVQSSSRPLPREKEAQGPWEERQVGWAGGRADDGRKKGRLDRFFFLFESPSKSSRSTVKAGDTQGDSALFSSPLESISAGTGAISQTGKLRTFLADY